MPQASDVIATLKQRIRDLDLEIALKRAEQRGLEVALAIVLGESALVAPVSMVEESPRQPARRPQSGAPRPNQPRTDP